MKHLLRAALASVLVSCLPATAAAGVEILSPRDGGVVIGGVAPVEVRGAAAPPLCWLDGVLVLPAWEPGVQAKSWVADLPLGGAGGSHVLEFARAGGGFLSNVFGGGARRSVRFTSAADGAVALGDRVADHFLAVKPPERHAWQWDPGVFLYGLHRFADVSSDGGRLTAAIAAYHRHHEARGFPRIDYPDRCSPGLTGVGLARAQGDPAGLAGAGLVADYLTAEARNHLGAIDHLGTQSTMRKLADASAAVSLVLPWVDPITVHWAHSIWVDSLMMYALFCVQWGAHTGDAALFEFGLQQADIFARVLQDPRTGLFVHAWDVAHARPIGAVWLRGNGWVAATLVEMLDDVPAGHPLRPRLVYLLQDLMRGLLPHQLPNGLWSTLVEARTSYPESSGSALVAYAAAKGARLGYLPPAARDAGRRAFQALTARLRTTPHGLSVTGTSGATNALPAWTYRLVPRRADVDYGVGAYLLLAGELEPEAW